MAYEGLSRAATACALSSGELVWEIAVGAIIFAGVLDGIDGRIARLLRGESRFGAELILLSDSIAFYAFRPRFILYLWSLQEMPRFGWVVCSRLAPELRPASRALQCQYRCARSATQNCGLHDRRPAPAGAGLALLPLYAWFITGMTCFRDWRLVAPWIVSRPS